jgi:hypothetical protein
MPVFLIRQGKNCFPGKSSQVVQRILIDILAQMKQPDVIHQAAIFIIKNNDTN